MTTTIPSRDDQRDDAAGQHDRATLSCPCCCVTFAPSGRQAHCSPACRQKAYRQRRLATRVEVVVPTTPQRGRREVTVYQCDECDEMFLGQQWCPDCQRPCRRLGLGGSCPHCDEPVTIDQLIKATP